MTRGFSRLNKRPTSPGKSYQAWIMSVAGCKLVGSGSGLLSGYGSLASKGRGMYQLWEGTTLAEHHGDSAPAGMWELAQPGNWMPRVSSARESSPLPGTWGTLLLLPAEHQLSLSPEQLPKI